MVQPKKQQTQGKETKSGRYKKTTRQKDKYARRTIGGTWTPSNKPYNVQIGDRDCLVFISDESAKININKITDETRANFIKFLISFKIKEYTAEIITDSILDWFDEDDLHHVNGAEKDFYAAQEKVARYTGNCANYQEELASFLDIRQHLSRPECHFSIDMASYTSPPITPSSPLGPGR
ncbi:MAG: hypothetical protein A2Z57_01745 [Planctomycetes bacterium RIFCSPHIGHO2_12_39_6]|nr:MAG: hypothetical protein A2Z57_01745 [Planctomycetes bacterium RIFCSPHIGHO2_12_39_6]